MVENWVFPGNCKFFDIPKYISEKGYIVWKYTNQVQLNDNIYIYLGAPYSQIKYRGVVIELDIPREIVNEQYEYAVPHGYNPNTKFLKIRILNEFEDGVLKFADLKKKGLGQVQKQARASSLLLSSINSVPKDKITEFMISEV